MDPMTLGLIFAASNPGVQQGVTNVLGKLPIVGGLFGSGGQTDAEKALIRRQQQMAEMVRRRQEHQALTAPQLQGTAQQMLAFDPLNRAMASMHGPQAAFSPEQMANMVRNPNPMPGIDEWAQGREGAGGVGGEVRRQAQEANPWIASKLDDKMPKPDETSLVNYQGTDPAKRGLIEEYIRQKQMYDEAERRRRQTVLGGIQNPGPGPAPLGPRAAPMAARRF